jgi:phage gp36-like protein
METRLEIAKTYCDRIAMYRGLLAKSSSEARKVYYEGIITKLQAEYFAYLLSN